MNCRVVFIGRIENNETKMLLLFNIITLNTWNIYANNYVIMCMVVIWSVWHCMGLSL